MALADVYDALISKRVYKPAFSHKKVMAIITEGRGNQFEQALYSPGEHGAAAALFSAQLKEVLHSIAKVLAIAAQGSGSGSEDADTSVDRQELAPLLHDVDRETIDEITQFLNTFDYAGAHKHLTDIVEQETVSGDQPNL